MTVAEAAAGRARSTTMYEVLFREVAHYLDTFYPADPPTSLNIQFATGKTLSMPVDPLALLRRRPESAPAPPPGPAPPAEPGKAKRPDAHSPDFRSCVHNDLDYFFTDTQAKIVKPLWEARAKGTPDVGHKYLLEVAGSAGGDISDLFRNQPGD